MNPDEQNKTILVDGYNLMWTTATLNPVARFDFNHAKDLLILMLRSYQKKTSDNVILVLDGYKSRNPYTRRVEQYEVDLVITGRGVTADRWIMDTVERPGFAGQVVTSDREIVNFCQSRKVTVTSSGTFEKELMEKIESDRELMDLIRGRKQHFRARRQGRGGPGGQRRRRGRW